MALLKPSLTLVLDLDERVAGKETLLEVKRCYTYIGTPVVRTHAPTEPGDPVHNVARMIVGLGTRNYLHSADEGADDLWQTVVEHWIGNMLYKIGHNMRAFNKRQREIGLPELVFDRIDVELQGGALVVGLHPDPTSFVDDTLAACVGLARELLNDGCLEGAVRVDCPAEDAYETQRALAWEAWVAEHPEAELPPADADAAGAPAGDGDAEKDVASETCEPADGTDAQGDEADTASEPELSYEEWLERDKAAKSYENTAVAPTDSDALPAVHDADEDEVTDEPEPFTFEVDYDLWGVTFADGSTRLFDAGTRSFAD